MSSEKCSRRVTSAGGWHRHLCSRNGKVERNGKWYCKQHDPVAVEARRDARQREWEAKWKATHEAQRVAEEKRAHADRCAAALSGVPAPEALLGEVREVLLGAVAWMEADGCDCGTDDPPCALCAARALLQRLPGGGA